MNREDYEWCIQELEKIHDEAEGVRKRAQELHLNEMTGSGHCIIKKSEHIMNLLHEKIEDKDE